MEIVWFIKWISSSPECYHSKSGNRLSWRVWLTRLAHMVGSCSELWSLKFLIFPEGFSQVVTDSGLFLLWWQTIISSRYKLGDQAAELYWDRRCHLLLYISRLIFCWITQLSSTSSVTETVCSCQRVFPYLCLYFKLFQLVQAISAYYFSDIIHFAVSNPATHK